jgi:hypothetical protein
MTPCLFLQNYYTAIPRLLLSLQDFFQIFFFAITLSLLILLQTDYKNIVIRKTLSNHHEHREFPVGAFVLAIAVLQKKNCEEERSTGCCFIAIAHFIAVYREKQLLFL